MTHKNGDTCSDSNNVTVILPAHVIGRYIGSYLDRQSMNSLRLTGQEIYRSMDMMHQPWPQVRLSTGNKKLGIQSLAFSPDGNSLACRSRGGTIRLWNRQVGKQFEWPCPGPFCFGNLSFSPDNQVLACDGKGKSVRLFDAATGSCLQTFKGHQGAITTLAFPPTNQQLQLLASGSTDSTVRLWNRTTNQELATLTGHIGAVYSVAFSQDGQFLASGGTDRILRVWHVPKILHNDSNDFCQDLKEHQMTIVEVAFSETFLVSASLDMTVRLWSTQRRSSGPRDAKRKAGPLSFACVQILHLDWEALSMKFSSNYNELAVGTSNEKIQIWNLDSVDLNDNDNDDDSMLEPVTSVPGKLFSFAPGVMATSGKDGTIRLREW